MNSQFLVYVINVHVQYNLLAELQVDRGAVQL